jgi:2-polyprenyl-3-methyl-5-hydroxy-6-metoxy-1,4-benzoquinol methylase
MKSNIERNCASLNQLIMHLENCAKNFVPQLNSYVNISEYSNKIYTHAERFEVFQDDELIALLAFYFNISNKSVFITNISVDCRFQKSGLAKDLLLKCKKFAQKINSDKIILEVNKENFSAINFYQKNQFIITHSNQLAFFMEHKLSRDYNKEFKDNDRKYFYGFDIEVMHPYMLKAFLPFFKKGNMLELGSFKGDFTKKLLPHFNDITCVEASDEAVFEAQLSLGGNVRIYNSLFENLSLPEKYDHIVLTHVLEHITEPVAVLKKINEEWLSDTGRLFLVCPNANAPSRQIAVKMGLISHNSAVTLAEKEHGHQITYSLDTLERDAKLAGLRVIHRSGIFFKALANFQWDQLLQTDIISQAYLDGCYELGQQYPDLCSSIFLLCEKGK